jgi:hypothetical protein
MSPSEQEARRGAEAPVLADGKPPPVWQLNRSQSVLLHLCLYLGAHAAELAVKAWILKSGMVHQELKDIGHDLGTTCSAG